MIRVETRVRKSGNSLGVIIPSEVAVKGKLKQGDQVDVLVQKRGSVLREVFGTLKFDEPTKKMMKEIDKLMYNE